MIDVRVVYSNNNRNFQILRAYDGFVLYKSGKFKNFNNAELGLEIKLREHDNWKVMGVIHR